MEVLAKTLAEKSVPGFAKFTNSAFEKTRFENLSTYDCSPHIYIHIIPKIELRGVIIMVLASLEHDITVSDAM